jgi:hypothetical protein
VNALPDKAVTRTLPGSFWNALFTSYLGTTQEELEDGVLSDEDKAVAARQLVILYHAAAEGTPADLDGMVTEEREMLTDMLKRLGI